MYVESRSTWVRWWIHEVEGSRVVGEREIFWILTEDT